MKKRANEPGCVRKKNSRGHWYWDKESNDRRVQGIAQSQDFQGAKAEC